MSVSLVGKICKQTVVWYPKIKSPLSFAQAFHLHVRSPSPVKSFASMTQQIHVSENFFFKQLFDRVSCTYSYLVADTESKEAIIIDPVIDLADRDAKIIDNLGLKLKYSVNTHMHADHITGTGVLKKLLPGSQSVISTASQALADKHVAHGDILEFGNHKMEVRATPGHTNGCVTYVCHEQGIAFTGDTLLIRGCGRTDFQEGNPERLYDSVYNQIFSLPDNFRLFPAHDYNGILDTTVWEEKKFNPRLTKSKEQFVEIMNNLNLAYPAQIDKALPANKVCGLYNLPPEMEEKYKSVLKP
ncbi:hypothetical protein GHT06_019185 [Daphnia sinensis]|uniref:Persulfide dioxygenase ETHE1, mitochondrial n=1 Tax=Daphnia sinensis TaxID=1820382 RepID=A0AAD5L0D6_9CRUS|nr:hypothetical protein GHT06_019185 [Daphnia sinensis]